jgi:hypothetical protein
MAYGPRRGEEGYRAALTHRLTQHLRVHQGNDEVTTFEGFNFPRDGQALESLIPGFTLPRSNKRGRVDMVEVRRVSAIGEANDDTYVVTAYLCNTEGRRDKVKVTGSRPLRKFERWLAGTDDNVTVAKLSDKGRRTALEDEYTYGLGRLSQRCSLRQPSRSLSTGAYAEA